MGGLARRGPYTVHMARRLRITLWLMLATTAIALSLVLIAMLVDDQLHVKRFSGLAGCAFGITVILAMREVAMQRHDQRVRRRSSL